MLAVVIPGVLIAGNCSMAVRARTYIYATNDQVPPRVWAIVPGAAVHDDGTPSPALVDRLDAARALFAAGRVQRIYVSGDGRDHEDGVMARWLADHGVPDAAIVRDPVGYRTRTTMTDAYAFGIRDAIVCTQAFHLPRSVLWARHVGIDAVGLVADRLWDRQTLSRLREVFARTFATVEMWVAP